MKDLYWRLDKLGRKRLSQNFYMRQFLYSEIGVAFGIPNIPDNPDLAIETGTRLCLEILEPIVRHFGPIIIRSGFRSAKLNSFGASRGLQCASNEKNFAYHIWDHLDQEGHKGAAACVVITSLVDDNTLEPWKSFAGWVDDNLNYHRLTFFSRDFAFNIGWHEAPKREIFSRIPKPHWFLR